MPQFLPFQALRYSSTLRLDDVCAPPYDVQSQTQRATWANRHPYNIVHLDMPVGNDPYVHAATRLAKWRSDGILVLDPSPCLTLYRMTFVDASGKSRHTVGVVGALTIDEADSRQVLPHEQTTPKAKTDRLELIRATKTNLSPIWGLSLTRNLSDELIEPGELLGSMTDQDGVVHRAERVDDPQRCARISELIAQNPVVIADGHHRYAVSRTYRDEQRALHRHDMPSGIRSNAEATLAYVNELVDEQLSVAAIHRLYSGISYPELLSVLGASFDVRPIQHIYSTIIGDMANNRHLTLMSRNGAGAVLTPKVEAFRGVRQLDSARLEHALRTCQHNVTYQHGLDEVREQLSSGAYDAAILIRPVSVVEIQRTAGEGLLMPPKSTFFTPKLRTGLVLRPLEN